MTVSGQRRNYRRKTLERKSRQVQEMTVQQAERFFQGKFYSSDEDHSVKARRKKRDREKFHRKVLKDKGL